MCELYLSKAFMPRLHTARTLAVLALLPSSEYMYAAEKKRLAES